MAGYHFSDDFVGTFTETDMYLPSGTEREREASHMHEVSKYTP